MSRVGQRPIPIPSGVDVKIVGREVSMKGNKGELSRFLHEDITVALKEGELVVSRRTDSKEQRALHGLTRSLLANMIIGVSEGFEKILELNGVGYRGQASGKKLVFQVGFSHSVEFAPAEGVSVSINEGNRVCVAGIDREAVGEAAANIRKIRPADAYKGKGFKYLGEMLRLKPGKAGKAGKA
jgi:large subunit ribosomal protein L6